MCQFNRNYRPCDDDKIVVSGYGGGDFVAARYNAGVGLDQRLYVQQDANFNVTSVSNGNSVLERYRFTPYGQRTVLNNDFTADIDNTSDYSFDAGHQGLKHDAETGLIYNRARMRHPTLGRFTGRDPLGYVDGMSVYALASGNPTNFFDPEGLNRSGHHYVPGQIYRYLPNSPARDVWSNDTTGPLADKDSNKWGPAHQNYNNGVIDELSQFEKEKGKLAKHFTHDEAKEFSERIKNSKRPEIRNLNRKIEAEARKHAKELAEKAAEEKAKKESREKLAKKIGKKTVKSVFSKIPLVFVATAAYDTYQGGPTHAVNEATWPLSELWSEGEPVQP